MLRWIWLVVLAGCGDEAVQEAAEGAKSLEGASYVLEWGQITVEGGDATLATVVQMMMVRDLAIYTHNVTDAAMDMRMVYMDDDAEPFRQDLCTPTTDLPGAALDTLSFETEPADTPIVNLDGSFWTMFDMHIAGEFTDSIERVEDATLWGMLDTRQGKSPEEALDQCDLLSGFGLHCGACSDAEPFCVDLVVHGIRGTRHDIEVQAVDAPDC